MSVGIRWKLARIRTSPTSANRRDYHRSNKNTDGNPPPWWPKHGRCVEKHECGHGNEDCGRCRRVAATKQPSRVDAPQRQKHIVDDQAAAPIQPDDSIGHVGRMLPCRCVAPVVLEVKRTHNMDDGHQPRRRPQYRKPLVAVLSTRPRQKQIAPHRQRVQHHCYANGPQNEEAACEGIHEISSASVMASNSNSIAVTRNRQPSSQKVPWSEPLMRMLRQYHRVLQLAARKILQRCRCLIREQALPLDRELSAGSHGTSVRNAVPPRSGASELSSTHHPAFRPHPIFLTGERDTNGFSVKWRVCAGSLWVINRHFIWLTCSGTVVAKP